jgi:hypothetical protein
VDKAFTSTAQRTIATLASVESGDISDTEYRFEFSALAVRGGTVPSSKVNLLFSVACCKVKWRSAPQTKRIDSYSGESGQSYMSTLKL